MSDPVTPVQSSTNVDVTAQIPSRLIERYFARPSHGSGLVFEGTFRLDRVPDVTRCQLAWKQTISRHPRLHSKLTGKGRRQTWHVKSFDETSHFFCQVKTDRNDDDVDAYVSGDPMPCVRVGRGAAMVVCTDAADPFIRFRFHHAACDGVGAGRVMADFFAAFHSRQTRSQEPQSDQPTEVSKISSEGAPIPDLRNTWKTIRGRNVRFNDHISHSNRKSPRSLMGQSAITLRSIAPHTLGFELDAVTSAALRKTLRARSIPLNDFAVAATSLALADCSQESASPRTHVMVMNPVAMRSWADRRCSANHLGFSFIRRRHDQLGWSGLHDIDGVLSSIHTELSDVRRLGIAGELVWGIGLMEKIPGGLGLIERLGWFTPTASVTCLSSIRFARRYGFSSQASSETGSTNAAVIGDAVVKSFLGSGPLQSGGQLAVTICDLGGQIAWSFRTSGTQRTHQSAIENIAQTIQRISLLTSQDAT